MPTTLVSVEGLSVAGVRNKVWPLAFRWLPIGSGHKGSLEPEKALHPRNAECLSTGVPSR